MLLLSASCGQRHEALDGAEEQAWEWAWGGGRRPARLRSRDQSLQGHAAGDREPPLGAAAGLSTQVRLKRPMALKLQAAAAMGTADPQALFLPWLGQGGRHPPRGARGKSDATCIHPEQRRPCAGPMRGGAGPGPTRKTPPLTLAPHRPETLPRGAGSPSGTCGCGTGRRLASGGDRPLAEAPLRQHSSLRGPAPGFHVSPRHPTWLELQSRAADLPGRPSARPAPAYGRGPPLARLHPLPPAVRPRAWQPRCERYRSLGLPRPLSAPTQLAPPGREEGPLHTVASSSSLRVAGGRVPHHPTHQAAHSAAEMAHVQYLATGNRFTIHGPIHW